MALHAFYPKVPGFSLGSRASFGGSRDASPRAAPCSTAQGRPNGDGRLSKSLAAGILNFHLNACASESQSLSQSRTPPSPARYKCGLPCTVRYCPVLVVVAPQRLQRTQGSGTPPKQRPVRSYRCCPVPGNSIVSPSSFALLLQNLLRTGVIIAAANRKTLDLGLYSPFFSSHPLLPVPFAFCLRLTTLPAALRLDA